MGFYVEHMPDGTKLPAMNKADILLSIPGAYQIYPPPTKWEDDLICVVENATFDAAAFVFNQQELNRVSRPDGRRVTWLHVPDAGGLTYYGRITPKEERNFER